MSNSNKGFLVCALLSTGSSFKLVNQFKEFLTIQLNLTTNNNEMFLVYCATLFDAVRL